MAGAELRESAPYLLDVIVISNRRREIFLRISYKIRSLEMTNSAVLDCCAEGEMQSIRVADGSFLYAGGFDGFGERHL